MKELKILEKNAQAILGATAGIVLQRVAYNRLSGIQVIADNKEILSAVTLALGLWGRNYVKGKEAFFDGLVIAGAVNLLGAVMLRLGLDVV